MVDRLLKNREVLMGKRGRGGCDTTPQVYQGSGLLAEDSKPLLSHHQSHAAEDRRQLRYVFPATRTIRERPHIHGPQICCPARWSPDLMGAEAPLTRRSNRGMLRKRTPIYAPYVACGSGSRRGRPDSTSRGALAGALRVGAWVPRESLLAPTSRAGRSIGARGGAACWLTGW